MALSDYKNPEYIKAHARSYGAGEEELLNVAAIVQRFCIKAVVFYNWQEKGWPARGDKPLPSTPEPLGVYGRTESTYLTSRVKQVLSWTPFIDPSGKRASGWLDAVTWRDRLLRIWRTALGARAVYPNLTRWRLQQILQEDPRSDRTDNRGKVTRQEIRARYYRGIGLHVPAAEVTLYLDDHLKTIVEFEPNEPLEKIKIRGREYWQRPVHVDTDGRHWLTNAQLMERHGVSGHFVSYWARQQSRIRPGQKALRKKLIANELPGNRQQIDVYLDEDALDILAGKEAKRPGAGKGRTPTKLRLAMAELAKEAVC
ncbi:MAG TPA: hypothetical protein VKE94_11990, partial [Gemmataceae bacterium]|nr:hypothetical protein [Gemmataceae bacterium]